MRGSTVLPGTLVLLVIVASVFAETSGPWEQAAALEARGEATAPEPGSVRGPGPAAFPAAPAHSRRAAAPGVTLALYPPRVALRDGVTEAHLTLHARDRRGHPIDLRGRRIRFRTSDPDLVTVTDDGTVRATGFGRATVEATVSGVPGVAIAHVRAGSSRIDPPLLYLRPEGDRSRALLRWVGSNADGSPALAEELDVTFSCNRCGPEQAVELEDGSQIRARHSSGNFQDVAVVQARSATTGIVEYALVLVLEEAIPGRPRTLMGERVGFFTHPEFPNVNILETWDRFRAVEVTDHAHRFLTELIGAPAGDGDRIVLAHGLAQNTGLWRCGFASAPIWLGSETGLGVLGSRSCFVDLESGSPAWGVFFHEMGHLFGGSERYSQGFAKTTDPDDPYLSFYGEDFASFEASFVGAMLRQRARRLGIPRRIVRSVLRHWGVHWRDTETLDEYVANGADYEGMPGGPGGIFRAMMWTLAQEHGWGAAYRFYSIFLPFEAEFSFEALGVADRATFFAAAWSAATDTDLSSRFRDEWGFPIDETLYSRMLREMIPAAALRDPVVDAGRNRRLRAGNTLRITDARVIDYEGDPVRHRWRIVDSPAGSRPRLRGARLARPRFSATTPGDYVLELTGGDDLLQRRDTVRIRVVAGEQ